MTDVLRDLFNRLDTDQSGMLSFDELNDHLHDENLQGYFLVLEMDPEDARDLFVLLDVDGSGELSINTFVNGCLRRSKPKSSDLFTCIAQGQRILKILGDEQSRSPRHVWRY